jgi:hypothetical protein
MTNVGDARVEKTTGYRYLLYEGQDIGQVSGSPVDFTYTPPFPAISIHGQTEQSYR